MRLHAPQSDSGSPPALDIQFYAHVQVVLFNNQSQEVNQYDTYLEQYQKQMNRIERLGARLNAGQVCGPAPRAPQLRAYTSRGSALLLCSGVADARCPHCSSVNMALFKSGVIMCLRDTRISQTAGDFLLRLLIIYPQDTCTSQKHFTAATRNRPHLTPQPLQLSSMLQHTQHLMASMLLSGAIPFFTAICGSSAGYVNPMTAETKQETNQACK
jgi:hypothetical protein